MDAPLLPPAPNAAVPSQSTTLGGISGAIAILIFWACELHRIVVPPQVACAITLVISTTVAYIARGGRAIHTS